MADPTTRKPRILVHEKTYFDGPGKVPGQSYILGSAKSSTYILRAELQCAFQFVGTYTWSGWLYSCLPRQANETGKLGFNLHVPSNLSFVQTRQTDLCEHCTVKVNYHETLRARCIKIVRPLPCPCPCLLSSVGSPAESGVLLATTWARDWPGTQAQMLDSPPRPPIDLSQVPYVASGPLVLTSGRFASAKPSQGRKAVRVNAAAVSCRQIVGEMGRVYIFR